jgi:hypothetical protein
VNAEGLAAPARPAALGGLLASSLAARISHDAHWPDRIAELLAGQRPAVG